MNEFNLLSSLKKHLQHHIPDQIIVFTQEQQTKSGFCLITIDEISPAPLSLSKNDVQSRIKFHTTCFHDTVGIKNSLEQSQLINRYLDGHVILLSHGGKAMIKMLSSTVEISKSGQEKTVSHFYESIIRGN